MIAQPDFRDRIPSLDGIRGGAILLVLICHNYVNPAVVTPGSIPAYLRAIGQFTWSGVDLFFVLSGFLIGGILIDARVSPQYYQSFYLRRCYRILPLYFTVIASAYLFIAFPLGTSQPALKQLFEAVPPWYVFGTFTQNVWMVSGTVICAEWLAPTWSLAVEEQFYLTLPFIIRRVKLDRLPWLLLGIICITPLTRACVFFYAGLPQPEKAVYALMPCRADALLLGVLAAYLVRKRAGWEFLVKHRRGLTSTFIVLGSVVAILTIKKVNTASVIMITGGYTVLALFYLSLLLIAVTQPTSVIGRTLRITILMRLGGIAYGLYLIHYLVLGLCHFFFQNQIIQVTGWRDVFISSVALLLSVGIATLSWRYLEKPILSLGRRHSHTHQSSNGIVPVRPEVYSEA